MLAQKELSLTDSSLQALILNLIVLVAFVQRTEFTEEEP